MVIKINGQEMKREVKTAMKANKSELTVIGAFLVAFSLFLLGFHDILGLGEAVHPFMYLK
ncbi:hypothetical protein IMZ31_22960 (plasmid) [Pontibacillus sp. ALD_SL1]|uniref:hypothetical protein n=1 Tax=Pontibacillus sp. ALD_SL1 TaxID=2777185 RepID=UPI001A96ECF0|nr:hypothetical protein [Pontibacillus sp. ALD_SL1]QST02314.1 hypothetical protein IMZ31_22960 [Pontibacillus sp. ALD_SL1]